MVTVTTRNKIKRLTWTNEGLLAFERLKALVYVYPKHYIFDYSSQIILYTDAFDMGHTFANFDQTRVSLKNQFVSWVAYSTGPRHIVQLLRMRLTPFIGPLLALTTWLAAFTLRYEQTTGTYFS